MAPLAPTQQRRFPLLGKRNGLSRRYNDLMPLAIYDLMLRGPMMTTPITHSSRPVPRPDDARVVLVIRITDCFTAAERFGSDSFYRIYS